MCSAHYYSAIRVTPRVCCIILGKLCFPQILQPQWHKLRPPSRTRKYFARKKARKLAKTFSPSSGVASFIFYEGKFFQWHHLSKRFWETAFFLQAEISLQMNEATICFLFRSGGKIFKMFAKRKSLSRPRAAAVQKTVAQLFPKLFFLFNLLPRKERNTKKVLCFQLLLQDAASTTDGVILKSSSICHSRLMVSPRSACSTN